MTESGKCWHLVQEGWNESKESSGYKGEKNLIEIRNMLEKNKRRLYENYYCCNECAKRTWGSQGGRVGEIAWDRVEKYEY